MTIESSFLRRTPGTLLARLFFAGLAMLLIVQPTGTGAQLSYSKGQSVSPAYEGWEKRPDGSHYFIFGYMNRNWEEELDVPVGPDNNMEPGGPDQGQPTHFLPRRNAFLFQVRVPDHFGEKDELTWTLQTHGVTERAYASLKSDYFVDDLVRALELGAVSGGSVTDQSIYANKPPTVKLDGEKGRTVKVGQPLTLIAWASDDGIPKQQPAGLRGGRRSRDSEQDSNYAPPDIGILMNVVGLRLSWFVYRGAGEVTFSPEQTKVWEDTRPGANSPWAPFWVRPPVPPDGKWTVQATFHERGTYVLRCLASDGALVAYEDLTISVTG